MVRFKGPIWPGVPAALKSPPRPLVERRVSLSERWVSSTSAPRWWRPRQPPPALTSPLSSQEALCQPQHVLDEESLAPLARTVQALLTVAQPLKKPTPPEGTSSKI